MSEVTAFQARSRRGILRGSIKPIKWPPQGLHVVRYWAGRRLIHRRSDITSSGYKRAMELEVKEFTRSQEDVTSKLHKSIKPEKNNMYHMRWSQQHRLHNREGKCDRKRKEFFVLFMGKWNVIEDVETRGRSGDFLGVGKEYK